MCKPPLSQRYVSLLADPAAEVFTLPGLEALGFLPRSETPTFRHPATAPGGEATSPGVPTESHTAQRATRAEATKPAVVAPAPTKMRAKRGCATEKRSVSERVSASLGKGFGIETALLTSNIPSIARQTRHPRNALRELRRMVDPSGEDSLCIDRILRSPLDTVQLSSRCISFCNSCRNSIPVQILILRRCFSFSSRPWFFRTVISLAV